MYILLSYHFDVYKLGYVQEYLWNILFYYTKNIFTTLRVRRFNLKLVSLLLFEKKLYNKQKSK